ncbi:MAG: hypothetical protein VYC31_04685 [Pseudomonadota bacterium]|nr:hypothetical protein [Pseudomonadota bacterium]
MVKAADLYHQASTRGGRAVDAVLAGKAVFKEGMLAVGGAMVDLGLAVAHTVKDKDDATAALIGLGFIVSGVAAAIAGAGVGQRSGPGGRRRPRPPKQVRGETPCVGNSR